MRSSPSRRPDDICTRLGDDHHRFLGAAAPPVFQTSLFVDYEGRERDVARDGCGYTYSRMGNPTVEIAERRIAALEGGEEARCFGSGMGAISAAATRWLAAGDHVVCVRYAYGPTRGLLETFARRFGIEVSWVMGTEVAEFEAAITPRTRLVYLETPCTYLFALQDIAAVAALARRRGIATVVDNTWASPLFQRPLDLGADLVVHSCSKYLGGHSDVVAGVAVGSREVLQEMTHRERALFGSTLDPFAAWLLVRGMRTLHLRMERHQESTRRITGFLEGHPKVERVLWPGLASHPQHELARRQMAGYSGVFSFFVKATPADADALQRRLRWFLRGGSWGGHESLIGGIGLEEHGRRWCGSEAPGLRVSVGLESPDTLIEDLARALDGLP